MFGSDLIHQISQNRVSEIVVGRTNADGSIQDPNRANSYQAANSLALPQDSGVVVVQPCGSYRRAVIGQSFVA